MRNLLVVIILILLILWALGFFAFALGASIHFLLVIAVVLLVIELIRGGRTL